MLQVYKNIGQITTGIVSLEKAQNELCEGQREVEVKVSDLHQAMTNLVTKDECNSRHGEKPPAGHRSLFQRAAANAGDIMKVMTLISAVAVGLWAVHKFAIRVETALDRTAGQTVKATRELEQHLDKPGLPQVVYVPVAVTPDAGPRRPARRPRRAPTKRARDTR